MQKLLTQNPENLLPHLGNLCDGIRDSRSKPDPIPHLMGDRLADTATHLQYACRCVHAWIDLIDVLETHLHIRRTWKELGEKNSLILRVNVGPHRRMLSQITRGKTCGV